MGAADAPRESLTGPYQTIELLLLLLLLILLLLSLFAAKNCRNFRTAVCETTAGLEPGQDGIDSQGNSHESKTELPYGLF